MLFPHDEVLAWQFRSGLAQLLWRERAKHSKDDPDNPKAPFDKAEREISDVRRRIGLEV